MIRITPRDLDARLQRAEGFQEVRDPARGHLLFKYDAVRRLIQVKAKGQITLIDLAQFEEGPPPAAPAAALPLLRKAA